MFDIDITISAIEDIRVFRVHIMKTVAITEIDQALLTYVAEAREENLILQLPDGSEFLLAEIDTFSREIALTRGNEQLMALLTERSQETKKVSLDQAKAMLDL
jgi:hypothetical protein